VPDACIATYVRVLSNHKPAERKGKLLMEILLRGMTA
jgi:hypothetical protein